MQMKMGTFVAVNIFIVAVLVTAVALGIWFIMGINVDTTEPEYQARLVRLEASAQIYFSRLGFYNGVCEDIGVSDDFSCHESETAYAIEARVPNSGYLCIDSTGFSGKTADSKGFSTICNNKAK